jgi:hypothetical protein
MISFLRLAIISLLLLVVVFLLPLVVVSLLLALVSLLLLAIVSLLNKVCGLCCRRMGRLGSRRRGSCRCALHCPGSRRCGIAVTRGAV